MNTITDAHAELIRKTMNPFLSDTDKLAMLALGLVGEAAEVSEHIKKHLYHGTKLDMTELQKELADVLYYLHALVGVIGSDLDTTMEVGIHKLTHRYPNGFVLGGGIRD